MERESERCKINFGRRREEDGEEIAAGGQLRLGCSLRTTARGQEGSFDQVAARG